MLTILEAGKRDTERPRTRLERKLGSSVPEEEAQIPIIKCSQSCG